MAKRDASSIESLRKEAAAAHRLSVAACEQAARDKTRSDDRRAAADTAASQARKIDGSAKSQRLDSALWAWAHQWRDVYALRCHEAEAAHAVIAALETALKEEERRAALLHGALVIAVARLEGRANP